MSARLSPARFFLIWLGLSLQSFGGGIATFALIRRAAVEHHSWMTDEEFTHDWGMVQLAPGINLLALTILIGRRVMGVRGIVLATIGLILPSATITTLLTAGYTHITSWRATSSAMAAVIPAIVALGFLTSVQMAVPLFKSSHTEGATALTFSIGLVAASCAVCATGRVPIALVLVGSGLAYGLFEWLRKRNVCETAL